MINKKNNFISVLFGGEAGDGIKEAGKTLGELLNKLGKEVFVLADYQSLIRGGHNFTRVIFSESKIWSHYNVADIIVALNQDTLDKHLPELRKEGIVFYDEDKATPPKKIPSVALPMSKSVKEMKVSPVMRNSVALGALCYYLGIKIEKLFEVFRETFKDKARPNIELAKIGYQHPKKLKVKSSKLKVKTSKTLKSKNVLISGNEAIAKGAVRAGLDCYIAYPMTPATSILHHLASHKKEYRIKVIQPENEIGVINMALGSSFAGKRTMIGTSGGGFALMQEAFSLAGMSETPLVIVESQRAAPSTGVPTYTAQADLKFVRAAGQGEFLRILLGPGDQEEAYLVSAQALNLTWKFQVPVIILSDKHLSESLMTSFLNSAKIKIERGKIKKNPSQNYKRYLNTADGISPLVFPGKKNVVVKFSSYEHNQFGYTTEDPKEVKEMQEKRFRKLKAIEQEMKKTETIKIFGEKNAENLIISWGSSKGAVLEAMKYLKKPAKFIQVIWLEPLDVKKLEPHLKSAKKVVDVELNYQGQLASIIREKTGFNIKNKILKYDSRAFDPFELAKKLNKIF